MSNAFQQIGPRSGSDAASLAQDRQQALPLQRQQPPARALGRILSTGNLCTRRQQIDNVADLAGHSAGLDHAGPPGNQRRRNPAFVDPTLVAAKGRVLGIGPAGPARDIALFRSGDVGRVVAARLLGAAAVVVEHQHHGVVGRAALFE